MLVGLCSLAILNLSAPCANPAADLAPRPHFTGLNLLRRPPSPIEVHPYARQDAHLVVAPEFDFGQSRSGGLSVRFSVAHTSGSGHLDLDPITGEDWLRAVYRFRP